MTKLLAIDIGNTNVTLGLFDYTSGKAALAHHWRIGTHRDQTSDEVSVVLRSLFDQAGAATREITDGIVSSVVPPLLPIWERVCSKLFDKVPLVVGPGIKTGMPVRYENPREVGADRIVNSVAAFEMFGGPIVAVDFGTATTFDCVSGQGEYLGGAIFPGIGIAMDALFQRTALLHRVELSRPKTVIGKTTTASLQSGLLFGYAGMVDTMVTRIRSELGGQARCIATGGLAQRIASETTCIERVEPFLTLEGLRILFEKNQAEGPRKER
jgi:type III pantothenate kinase